MPSKNQYVHEQKDEDDDSLLWRDSCLRALNTVNENRRNVCWEGALPQAVDDREKPTEVSVRIQAELDASSIEYYADQSMEPEVPDAGDQSMEPDVQVDEEKEQATMLQRSGGIEVKVRFTSFKDWYGRFSVDMQTLRRNQLVTVTAVKEELRKSFNNCAHHYNRKGANFEAAKDLDEEVGESDYVQVLEDRYIKDDISDWQGGRNYDIRHECYVLYYVPPEDVKKYADDDKHLLTIYTNKDFKEVCKQGHGEVLTYMQTLYYERRPDAEKKEYPPAFYCLEQLGRATYPSHNSAIKGVAEVALMHFLRSPYMGRVWSSEETSPMFKSARLDPLTAQKAEELLESTEKANEDETRRDFPPEEIAQLTYKPLGPHTTKLWWPPIQEEQNSTDAQNRMSGTYTLKYGEQLSIERDNCVKQTSLYTMRNAMAITKKYEHPPPCRLPVVLMVDRKRRYDPQDKSKGLVPYYRYCGFREMCASADFIRDRYPQWQTLLDEVTRTWNLSSEVDRYRQHPLRVPWKSTHFASKKPENFEDIDFLVTKLKREKRLAEAIEGSAQRNQIQGQIDSLLDKWTQKLSGEHFALLGSVLEEGDEEEGDEEEDIYMIRFPARFESDTQGTRGKFNASLSISGGGHGFAKALRKKKK